MDLHRPNAFISMLTIFATWASCCKNCDNSCCPNIFLLTLTKPDGGDGLLKRLQVPISKKEKKKRKKKRKKEERKGCKFHEISWLYIFTFRRPKSISVWECQKKIKKKTYFTSSNTTLFILRTHFTTHFMS